MGILFAHAQVSKNLHSYHTRRKVCEFIKASQSLTLAAAERTESERFVRLKHL